VKKLLFVVILLCAYPITNLSFAQINSPDAFEQQDLSEEKLDSFVNEAYLMVISEMESDCECTLDTADAGTCSQIARVIGVVLEKFTDIDAETVKKIEEAIEEICEILKEEK
jgi:hypothetical protein